MNVNVPLIVATLVNGNDAVAVSDAVNEHEQPAIVAADTVGMLGHEHGLGAPANLVTFWRGLVPSASSVRVGDLRGSRRP